MATKYYCDRCSVETSSLKTVRIQRGSTSSAYSTDAETNKKEFCVPCEKKVWSSLTRAMCQKGPAPKPRGRRKK